MDFEICCSASNHITPKKQLEANWDAEDVYRPQGDKEEWGVISLFWIVFALSAPICWVLQMGGKCQKSGFDFLGLHLVEKVGRMFFVCPFEHFTVIMENWIWIQYPLTAQRNQWPWIPGYAHPFTISKGRNPRYFIPIEKKGCQIISKVYIG